MQHPLLPALDHLYAAERELGRGGMATVYLARDRKHDRPVAVKVLHPELAAGLAAERFLREIRIAANLQHPHIVPLHDSGEADGLLYYVMPYVEGESLRERLARGGRLPLNDAIRIGCEVAEALDYAHDVDVVHRDIKPANILLSRGHALVADFGIATAVSSAGGDDLTQTGLVVGTPVYMSPEQVEGSIDLDGRSDLYSLGCVLYEMLAGVPPFAGATVVAVMAQRALGRVEPLFELRPEVPPGVEHVVAKAMATDASERFGSGAHLADALRDAPAAAVERLVPERAPRGDSIAVLPFANMSADSENEYFCDGMAEEIINALAQLPSLEVAARTSAFAFKGRNIEITEIGRRLRVSTILEGSVRKVGQRLRITAQLINVADGYHLWSERFDRDLEDVFAIQDEIAAAIVDKLRPGPSDPGPVPPAKRGTDDPEAYNLYLKGRHLWYLRNLPQAVEAFQQAIAKDASFALPYCGIADAFSTLGQLGFVPTNVALARAHQAVERALAIEPGMPEALSALGMIDFYLGWNLAAAEEHLRSALAAKPHLSEARACLVMVLGLLGGREELDAEVGRGYGLEPLSAYFGRAVGVAYFFCQEPERAIEALERAVTMEPYSGPSLLVLGWAYQQAGNMEGAIETLERGVELSRRAPIGVSSLGIAYAHAGRVEEARAVAHQLRERASEGYVPPGTIAGVLASLGEIEEAMPWVERAFEDRNPYIGLFSLWPGLDGLRADPRYVALLEETGFGYLLERMR